MANTITPQQQKQLVALIKEKKELRNLDTPYIIHRLEYEFRRNNKLEKNIASVDEKTFSKNKFVKTIVKEVRKYFRTVYGSFILADYHKAETLILKSNVPVTPMQLKNLLSLHRSTKERYAYYISLYSQLFAITGKVKSILDLGCGLNPLSYPLLGHSPSYIASDMNVQDMQLLQMFFDKQNIKGETQAIDAATCKELPKAEMTFLFKLLDTLETTVPNRTKSLFPLIKSKWIVVSFPRQSLGGHKTIGDQKRAWFTKYLDQQHLSYQSFSTRNELFFVVKQ